MDEKWLTEINGFDTIIDISREYMKTRVLNAALNLGVFEILDKAGEPFSARNIAAKGGFDPENTEEFLNVCVGLKLLEKKLSDKAEGLYTNAPMTKQWLLKGSPTSLASFLAGNSIELVNLEESVRSGTCQWHANERKDKLLNWSEVLDVKSEAELHEFWELMHRISTIEVPFTSKAFDLTPYKTICDLGGCTGAFLLGVAERYPDCELILFDLPPVIKKAPRLEGSKFKGRIRLVEGDFFNGDIPSADLYVLSRILHDWNKAHEMVKGLLNKIYRNLPKGGGLLIIEQLLDEDKKGPMRTLLFSMWMACIQEGKELAFSQYKTMLEGVGFTDVQVKKNPYICAILAKKD